MDEIQEETTSSHNHCKYEQNGNDQDTKAKICKSRIKRYFLEYCEFSNIQGLSYITQAHSLHERLWWLVTFTLCVGGCSFMIYQTFDKWMTTPILVTFATKEKPIYDIPFPAVTICPESIISNQCVNYSKVLIARRQGNLQNTTFRQNQFYDYLSLLCKSGNHKPSMQLSNKKMFGLFSDSTSKMVDDTYPEDFYVPDYADFLEDCAAVNLKSILCQWMGVMVPCKDVMRPIITDEGLCYTFNMFDVREVYSSVNQMQYFERERQSNWNPDVGYPEQTVENSYPRRAFLNGAEHAFVAVVLTRKDQVDYGCKQFSLQGIRVTLTMPCTIPRPSQVFFSVGLDRLTTAAVSPTHMSVSDRIQFYDPQKRYCYFTQERQLKYFQIYSQANCNMECWTNYTIQNCGCVQYYMPRDNQTKICSLKQRYCLEKARVSYTEAVLSEKFLDQNENENKQSERPVDCECLPICADLTYNAELSSAVWDFANPDEAGFDTNRDFFDQFHASAVRVYFKDKYFLPTRRDELFGTTDFIADSGSVLGLFTGFSLISLAEIIYFLSVRLIENHRHFGNWAGQ